MLGVSCCLIPWKPLTRGGRALGATEFQLWQECAYKFTPTVFLLLMYGLGIVLGLEWNLFSMCAQKAGVGVRSEGKVSTSKTGGAPARGAGESTHPAAEGRVRGTGGTVCARVMALLRL